MALDLSQNPYFDDFDPTKDFYRLLFRPGYAVQARELTQIQTGLQKQFERFGSYVFKNGSMVLDGQTTLETERVKYLKLQKTNVNSQTIDVTNFLNTFIIDTTSRGVRAYVVAVDAGLDNGIPTLMVKYVSGAEFTNTENIQTEDTLYTATTIATSSSGNGSVCSINDGVFFVNGFFARVGKQTIILERYNATPSYRVGLVIGEAIIDENNDTSLLDPALEASNYQAPGAARYKLSLTLSKRSLTSTDDSTFIELLRVQSGILTKKIIYPQNSVLEDTMARRTYDESGNYVVRPFQIAVKSHSTYANAINVILEPGKAYVLGYEFETIAPTTIKNERARDVANVANYPLTIDYQNYVDVTKLKGPIGLDSLAPLTIHCVNTASINTTTVATAAATNMGTIRIRALDYQYGVNSTSISTGVWRAYVIDANASSYSKNCGGTGTVNTIQLDANASSITDAYAGVKIRIAVHAGTTINEVRQISAYNGTTKVATVSRNFSFGTPTTATIFSLDYGIKDAEAFVYGSSNVITTSMDVSSDSKLSSLVDPYQGTYITETNFNRSILRLPNYAVGESTVVGGTPITNSEYYGRKLYTQTFSSNVISFTTDAGITSAVNGSPLSGTDAIDNILVVTTSAGTLANNQVINFEDTSNTVSVTTSANTSTYTITVPNAGNQSAKVYVKVKLPYSHSLGSLRKSKQKQTANTKIIDTSTPTSISSGITWYKQSGTQGAQIVFATSAIGNLQIPNRRQSVYTADVIRLAGVYDFGTKAVTTANLASATNLTTSYNFNNGQTDNTYDHATIWLLPNKPTPKGNVVVFVDYYEHTGSGYLTVDSYIDAGIAYGSIPTYTSSQSAQVYYLRDCIDFRSRRKNADTAGLFDETILGISGTNFETDFCYYLPRIDKVVLTKDRTFEIVRGVSSLNPMTPADRDNSMTLYVLTLPAYTFNPADVKIKYVDNRRYTMRDIGTLEKRISNLEYYTSLTMLEQEAKNQQIVDDETGLNRFKNGILVDAFTGHNIGDVAKPDYACAIDQENQELRPPFYSNNFSLALNTTNSTNYARQGAIVTLSKTDTTFIEQPIASDFINVNPFNVVSFIGQIKLNPSSDVWVDTTQKPDVNVNETGSNDAWTKIASLLEDNTPNIYIYGTFWNNWQTVVLGKKIISQQQGVNKVWLPGNWNQQGTYITTLTDVTRQKFRTGVDTVLDTDVITKSIGNRVVNTTIIPYIRSRSIIFVGDAFRPDTILYSFFDDRGVFTSITRSNIIEVASNDVDYDDTYQHSETVRIYEPATGQNLASALVILSSNGSTTTNVSVVNLTAGDDGNISNVRVITANSTFLIGDKSGANTRIVGYHHYSGNVASATSNTIIISNDVLSSNTQSSLTGKQINITSGDGKGQYSNITAFNTTTKEATIFGTWTTLPTANSTYSIGALTSNKLGEVSGIFNLSSASGFRTGERVFRLIDVVDDDVENSSTNGEARYFAQGLLNTMQNTTLSTRVPVIRKNILTERNPNVDTTVVSRDKVGTSSLCKYQDPIAQTFLVDQRQYPNGIHLSAVRLIFKSKDESIPVQVQIRPVVNGYPHSTQILPFADVTVPPKKVKVVSQQSLTYRFKYSESFTPPLDDPNWYTNVQFSAPVVLQPGQEYAIVLISNSNKYETYISQMGEKIYGTDRIISQQPYLGSFFKSQNASTWTPSQDQDLMFRLIRANYNLTQAWVDFCIDSADKPTANVPIDTFFVTSQNLVLPNTGVSTYYSTTLATGGQQGYVPFDISDNVFFNDTLGRRVVTANTQSFRVLMNLTSLTPHISPMIDMERLSLLAIENRVNTLGLSNSDIVVTSSTTNYVNNNITVTITGGGGTGATANGIIEANTLTSVFIINPGTGYTGTPTVTVTGGGGDATVVVNGENGSSDGPSYARYITRRVVLADGMDAGDLRVYLSAYKTNEANIYVYYKLLSAEDPNSFDDQNYQLMTCIQGYNNISLEEDDFKDFVFAPGTNNTAANQISYSSYTNFRYFAIKIVMTSKNPTRVPRIKNLRAIATPALS